MWNLKCIRRVVGRIKAPKSCRNRSKGSPLWDDSLPNSGNFTLLGAAFPPRVEIGVKFCATKQTHVPLGHSKFHVNRCNEWPLRGENAYFLPVSKFSTGSLPLRDIRPVKTVQIRDAVTTNIHMNCWTAQLKKTLYELERLLHLSRVSL